MNEGVQGECGERVAQQSLLKDPAAEFSVSHCFNEGQAAFQLRPVIWGGVWLQSGVDLVTSFSGIEHYWIGPGFAAATWALLACKFDHLGIPAPRRECRRSAAGFQLSGF
jgi:hypothetical protein